MPAAPARAIRIPDDIWAAAGERARSEGRSVAKMIVAMLTAYAAGDWRPEPAAVKQKSEHCSHPLIRRIGTGCAACGKDPL